MRELVCFSKYYWIEDAFCFFSGDSSFLLVGFILPLHARPHSISTMKTGTLLSETPAVQESSVQSVLEEYELELTADGKHVRWSASNRRHPRNWSTSRKIYDTTLITFLDLFT